MKIRLIDGDKLVAALEGKRYQFSYGRDGAIERAVDKAKAEVMDDIIAAVREAMDNDKAEET